MRYLVLDDWASFYLKKEITEDDKLRAHNGISDIFDIKEKKHLGVHGWKEIPTWDDLQSRS